MGTGTNVVAIFCIHGAIQITGNNEEHEQLQNVKNFAKPLENPAHIKNPRTPYAVVDV